MLYCIVYMLYCISVYNIPSYISIKLKKYEYFNISNEYLVTTLVILIVFDILIIFICTLIFAVQIRTISDISESYYFNC